MAATLAELNAAMNEPTNTDRTRGALLKAAKDVTFEDAGTTNHANRLRLAKQILLDPVGSAPKFWRFIVGVLSARNLGVAGTPDDATILGVSDDDLYNNLVLGLNVFADGA